MKLCLAIVLLLVLGFESVGDTNSYPPIPTPLIFLGSPTKVILLPPPPKVIPFNYGKINRTNYLWRLMATQDMEHWFQVVYKSSDLDTNGILTIKAYGDNLFYRMEGKPK